MFKIIAEYIIILILLVACLLLYKNKHRFSQEVYKLLFSSFIFTILSEFCFTLYVSNSSTANEYGHYFKLIAFFLIYKSNVVTGFSKPTELIFKNLKDNEEKYRNLAENLKLVEQELKELNATKDKLFSIIAHDLKNPFTSLISYSELIYKNADKLSQEKVHHMARRMNHSAKQAYVLLDNLLSWSRVQTGLLKPKSEVVYATDLVNEAKQLADAFGKIKGIGIEVCSSSVKQLKTDPQMINTVLRNLVSNAIKFSHANSSVVLKTADKENCVEFAVCDFGVGIDMAHQPDILSMKNSVSRPGTSDETGTGLGLLLCREFVELCGGKIWFESEPGKGTTFYFTIPFEASVKVL